MDDAIFRGDCTRCIGLCCVALSFDRGPHFGFDKPAGEACRHLDRAFRCAVHERLEAEGFGGCARYDCHGAGQVVTAMFAGFTWRNNDAVVRQIQHAFALLRTIRRLELALRLAGGDPAPIGAIFDSYADLLLAAPSLIAMHTAKLRRLAAGRSISADIRN